MMLLFFCYWHTSDDRWQLTTTPIYSEKFSSLYIYIIYIKWLCKKPYPCKNKLPPCHRCHRHRCQLWVSDKNLPLRENFFSSGRNFFSLPREQKKALFHKNPKEKYKPQNQTMTDDSDDTRPNLFWWKVQVETLRNCTKNAKFCIFLHFYLVVCIKIHTFANWNDKLS